MNVLLTYDAPHRKTQDVAWRLMARGHQFSVLAVPWEDRKPRRFLYAHRPAEITWPCEPFGDPTDFFCALGIDYAVCPKDMLVHELRHRDPEVVIIGGAGILPKEITDSFKVLNVHPGLLPKRRGLDILKWTVLELGTVGVTAHLCDERTDLGWKISEKVVPCFRHDSFHSFAMRQYEFELSLINEALREVRANGCDHFERIEPCETEARRRMPRKIESQLPEAFERFKRIYAQ